MGYLYDPENQTYVHEAYCDENGNYDSSLLESRHDQIINAREKNDFFKPSHIQNLKSKKAKALPTRNIKSAVASSKSDREEGKGVNNNMKKINNESASIFSFNFK